MSSELKPTEATGDRDKPLAQGAVFVVKRHGRSIYNIMLFNRKASTDANQETLNVWIAGVPLGPSAKLEMKGANMFIHCPRSDKDFRLHFTENVDVQRMTDFCRYVLYSHELSLFWGLVAVLTSHSPNSESSPNISTFPAL